MPVIQMTTNIVLHKDTQQQLLQSLSAAMAVAMNKSQSDIMIFCNHADFAVNNTGDPAAYIEIGAIGDTRDFHDKQSLFDGLLKTLQRYIPIGPGRLFVKFSSVSSDNAWKN